MHAVGFAAIRSGPIRPGGLPRSAAEQYLLIQAAAANLGAELIAVRWDRYTSATVNLFNRPIFQAALAQAAEQGAVLIVSDLVKMFALTTDTRRLPDVIGNLANGPVQVIDAMLVRALKDIPDTTTMSMVVRALASRNARKVARSRTAKRAASPTDAARKAATDKRRRNADAFAQRVQVTIDSIRGELGADVSAKKVAARLNEMGTATSGGLKGSWSAAAVSRVLARIKGIEERKAQTAEPSQAVTGERE